MAARFDVVGIGENSVDLVYRLPGLPSPGGKIAASAYQVSCGGQVATALACCSSFGLKTSYVGTFGNDSNATRIREALAQANVDTSHALVRDAPNRHAVILVDWRTGERCVVWHRDRTLALNASEVPSSLVASARLLHVDDLDEEASIAGARIAVAAGVPVTSDIDRVTAATMELVGLSTVPIFSAHVPSELTGESDVERALRAVAGTRVKWACVTLGAEGALLLEGDRLHRLPAQAVNAVDTTGAGDVFRAAFIYALLQRQGAHEVLRFATAAAAAACTRQGAMDAVPALHEVIRSLTSGTSIADERPPR